MELTGIDTTPQQWTAHLVASVPVEDKHFTIPGDVTEIRWDGLPACFASHIEFQRDGEPPWFWLGVGKAVRAGDSVSCPRPDLIEMTLA